MKPMICAEGLSKKYRLAQIGNAPDSIREAVAMTLRGKRRERLAIQRALAQSELNGDAPSEGAPSDNRSTPAGEIWALREVSFSIARGEIVGIVGRNGSGKSTLLKILSRITRPTEGRVELHGHVASLLEVGSGFHSELSGRHNVFLNGAILGMKREEVERKFDEIVAFSEVGDFIDTPIKRYSSGMHMRLAFSVAVHLESQVLMVDEVLGVGDAGFRQKCQDKILELRSEGRTILLVSHSMSIVRALCDRAILLDKGRLIAQGSVDEISLQYSALLQITPATTAVAFPIQIPGADLDIDHVEARVVCVSAPLNETAFENADASTDSGPFKGNCERAHLQVDVGLNARRPRREIGIGLLVYTQHNRNLVSQLSPPLTGVVLREVDGRCVCRLESRDIDLRLGSGNYSITLVIYQGTQKKLWSEDSVATFEVPAIRLSPTGRNHQLKKDGIVPLPISFSVQNF